jgi:hypothetical protein
MVVCVGGGGGIAYKAWSHSSVYQMKVRWKEEDRWNRSGEGV